MKIKNTTYAGTPIATKLGTFTPDAAGILDVPEDVGKHLCALAGFASLERTPRVLAPAPDAVRQSAQEAPTLPAPPEAPPAASEAPARSEEAPVPPVLDVPETPATVPAGDVSVVMTPKRPKGPKPKA